MRNRGLVLSTALGALWSCAPSLARPTGRTLPVAVDVRCTASDVVFSVSPWHLELAEGDAAVWQLADNTQTIEIIKRQHAWPFKTNKFSGNQADPPNGKEMKSGQVDRLFRYAIAVSCQGSQGTRRIELDPDLYIKR